MDACKSKQLWSSFQCSVTVALRQTGNRENWIAWKRKTTCAKTMIKSMTAADDEREEAELYFRRRERPSTEKYEDTKKILPCFTRLGLELQILFLRKMFTFFYSSLIFLYTNINFRYFIHKIMFSWSWSWQKLSKSHVLDNFRRIRRWKLQCV